MECVRFYSLCYSILAINELLKHINFIDFKMQKFKDKMSDTPSHLLLTRLKKISTNF